jgi:hypothetical protein
MALSKIFSSTPSTDVLRTWIDQWREFAPQDNLYTSPTFSPGSPIEPSPSYAELEFNDAELEFLEGNS